MPAGSPLGLSLRAKLNIGLTAFLVIVAVAVAAIVVVGFNRSKDDATETASQGFEDQSRETLALLADVQSFAGQLQLDATAELSDIAARYMANALASDTEYASDVAGIDGRGGVVYDRSEDRTTDIWYRGMLPLDDATLRDLRESATLDAALKTLYEEQSKDLPTGFEAVAIYYIGTSGLVRYFPAIGLHNTLLPVFDVRAQEYFTAAAPAQNPERRTVWTKPYFDRTGRGRILTATTPVYVGDEFRGVVAVDLSFFRLISQVDNFQVGQTGFAFYVDALGDIAPSSSAPQVISSLSAPEEDGLPAVLAAMRDGKTGTDRIRLNGREVFVSYAPIAGAGGSLGLVAPVDEITAAAAGVTSAIADESDTTIVATLVTMSLLFLVVIAISAVLSRYMLLKPILALVEGTNAVAAGDLSTTIPVRSRDELGMLASSFNRMTAELQVGRAELEAKEAQFRGIFESTSDGVILNDAEDGTVAEANPAAIVMHGYTREEFIGIQPEKFIHPDSLSDFGAYMEAMAEDRPFRTRARDVRKDGTVFHVEVAGSRVQYLGRTHYLAIVRDVTERVQAYELLEERVADRTRELSTLLEVARTVGSTLELDRLLELILTHLHNVIDYTASSILIEDDGELVIRFSRGADPGVTERQVDRSIGMRFPVHLAEPIWGPISRGDVVLIGDVRADEPLANAYRRAVGDVDNGPFSHVRSWMAIPFIAKGRVLGFMSASRSEPNYFEQRHVDLARAFAAQATVALENARLFEETARRVGENEALARIAARFTLAESQADLLDGAAEEVLRATRAVGINLIINRDGEFEALGAAGWTEDYRAAVLRALEGGAIRIVQQHNESVNVRISPNGRERILSFPEWGPLHPFLQEQTWEALVSAPLVYRGQPFGAIGGYFPPGFVPSQREADFFRAMADQVAIGVANQRLFGEIEQRGRENLALATIASRFTLDEPVEQTLRDLAGDIVQATSALAVTVLVVDDDRPVSLGGSGLPDGYVEAVFATLADRGGPTSGLLAAARSGKPMRFPGSRQFALAMPEWHRAHHLLAEPFYEDMLAVPLIYRGGVVGTIAGYYPAGGIPGDDEVRFLEAIAGQAAIGIENLRLFAEADRRVRELESLTRVARGLTLDQAMSQTLDDIAANVVAATKAVGCTVSIVEPSGHLEAAGVANVPRALPRVLRELAVASGRAEPDGAAVTTRVLRDARQQILADPAMERARPYVEDAHWEALISTPLVIHGRTLGTLDTYYAPEEEPDAQESAILDAIANQAAAAIDNARLFTETEQRVRELEALTRIASSLTVVQPIGRTMDTLARIIVESTGAVACSVILADDRGDLRLAAQHGLPEGYMLAMAKGWRRGAPSPTQDAYRTGEIQVVHNARTNLLRDPAYAEAQPLLDTMRWDTLAVMPLVYEGRPAGILNCYFLPESDVNDRDMQFLRGISDQAALAVQNARLFDQAAERTRQLNALYNADEELHRSLNLDDVLQAIADVIVEFLGADSAAVVAWDAGTDRPRVRVAGTGFSQTVEALETELVEARGLRELEQARFRIVEDTLAEPDLDPREAERLGVRALMQVPIVVDGRMVGIFDANYAQPRRFTDAEQRVFLSLAQRAALALENARLFADAAERTRQLDVLYRADEQLHRSLRLDDVVQTLNDVAVQYLGADRSMFIRWSAEAGYPVPMSATGVDEEMYSQLAEAFRRMANPAGFENWQPVYISDALEDSPMVQLGAQIAKVHSVAQLPVLVGEKVFGLYLMGFEQRQSFPREVQRMFGALAQRAGIAIENAQLYEQAQNLAAVEERQRLARELHDSVSQALYGIALGARTARTLLDRDPTKAVEPVDYVLQLAEAGLAEMRALIFELRPESLANEGIVRAIEKHVASLHARYGIRVDAVLGDEPEVPLLVKEALYRIMQEALHNTVKHARAQNVRVALGFDGEVVTLDIRDDGAGFDSDGEFPGHLGLKSMRERALRLGGSVTIHSKPGEGTQIVASIPK
ncbi:MAG: GAF domain-containing protein [Dehalococcoidia bacterium]|nr:GAF domain-containing protein [Dehalococcoidia bacterium]